jgi:hypothetical protein
MSISQIAWLREEAPRNRIERRDRSDPEQSVLTRTLAYNAMRNRLSR